MEPEKAFSNSSRRAEVLGLCVAMRKAPGQAVLLDTPDQPCTPSPQGWGGQQGLSLPRASFQGTRGAEEGLLQCGGPSHRWAQAPVLPRAMGAKPGFRPSEKGPVTMAPQRSHCLDNPVAP